MKGKVHSDVYIGAGCLLFTAFFLFQTARLPSGPNVFPYITLAASAVFELVIIVQGIVKTGRIRAGSMPPEEKAPGVFRFWLCILAYFALFYFCGYIVANLVFMIIAMRELGIKNWKLILLVTVVYTLLIYLIFVVGFHVPLQRFGKLDRVLKTLIKGRGL